MVYSVAGQKSIVSGYIEYAGEVVKICSVEDIERVLGRLRKKYKKNTHELNCSWVINNELVNSFIL